MEIQSELKKFFTATDRLRDDGHDKHWEEEKIMSENRLRKALGIPVSR